MTTAIFAGTATSGKTTVIRHVARRLLAGGTKVSYLKLDVQYAEEDEILAREFGIPTRKVYSGELCPDHCSVMVLGDALEWARKNGSDMLLVETAGLCLRCSPYVDGGLGVVRRIARGAGEPPAVECAGLQVALDQGTQEVRRLRRFRLVSWSVRKQRKILGGCRTWESPAANRPQRSISHRLLGP